MKVSKSMWDEASNELFQRIRQPVKLLGRKPLDLMPRLRILGFNYFLSVPAKKPPTPGSVKNPRTRGRVVNDLQVLFDATPRRQQRLIKTLRIDSVSALFGLFPTSGLKMHERLNMKGEGEGEVIHLLAPEQVLPAAWKSRTAHRSIAGAQIPFWVEEGSMGRLPLLPSDLVKARERLASFSRESPDLFRQGLKATIEDLLDTLQLRGQSVSGRNIALDAGVSAGVDWRLINRVLDYVWPIEKGPMAPQQISAARAIIEATKIFALESQGEKVRNQFDVIDWSRGANLMALRHQIGTLNSSIRFVEKRKFELQSIDNDAEGNWDRWLRLSNVAFFPLLDWRRELERRLQFGDYRAWNETVRRPTGPVLATPAFPKFTKADGLLRRTLVLIRAARPLQPEAGLEISAKAA